MTTIDTVLLVAQILVNITILGTFILYYVQLRTMQRQLATERDASQSQNLLAAFSFLQQVEVRDARRRLIGNKGKPLAEWLPEEISAANAACGSYDLVANLVRFGIVPLEPIVNIWGYSIIQCHDAAQELIGHYRSPEGRSPTYWDEFEWLWQEARSARPEMSAS